MVSCIDGKGFKTWQEALESAKDKDWVWGARATPCRACNGLYHAKANVARDWGKQPLGHRTGPKLLAGTPVNDGEE